MAGISSSSGMIARAPSRSHSAAAARVGLAHHDVVDASGAQRGDREEADRAAAGDEVALGGIGAAAAE